MSPDLRQRLALCAARPYRASGRFAYHWAHNKLRWDPMFPALLDARIVPDGGRVLDLGCGRSLLAAWFLGAERLALMADRGELAAAPRRLQFEGYEINERHADCGRSTLASAYGPRNHVHSGDMRGVDFQAANVVALLDALHYIPHDDQERLLDRVRPSLAHEGVLVIRVGDDRAGLRARLSALTDRVAVLLQARRWRPLFCRPLEDWIELLRARELDVAIQPMSEGTPFANFLLVARPLG